MVIPVLLSSRLSWYKLQLKKSFKFCCFRIFPSYMIICRMSSPASLNWRHSLCRGPRSLTMIELHTLWSLSLCWKTHLVEWLLSQTVSEGSTPLVYFFPVGLMLSNKQGDLGLYEVWSKEENAGQIAAMVGDASLAVFKPWSESQTLLQEMCSTLQFLVPTEAQEMLFIPPSVLSKLVQSSQSTSSTLSSSQSACLK